MENVQLAPEEKIVQDRNKEKNKIKLSRIE